MSVSLAKSRYFVKPGRCGTVACTMPHEVSRVRSLWNNSPDQYRGSCSGQKFIYESWMVDAHPVRSAFQFSSVRFAR